MNGDNTLVSIIVITYGHENYIRQALDSILMQNVNFKYEVLVGEDCSPDNTRSILKEYEKKNMGKFIIKYRDVNIGMWGNLLDLMNSAKGKYIAFLEGDDFWVCEDKLQKQVNFLENNDDYIATAHNVKIVDKYDNEIINVQYPECKNNLYRLIDYKKGILPGQTASIVMRNEYKDKLLDVRLMTKMSLYFSSMPADRVIIYLLASRGKIYCFQNNMSAYRYVTDSGTSFNATIRKLRNNIIRLSECDKTIVKYSQEFINNKEAIKTIECIYFFDTVFPFLRRYKEIRWNHVSEAWKIIRNRKAAVSFLIFKLITIIIRKIVMKINGKSIV